MADDSETMTVSAKRAEHSISRLLILLAAIIAIAGIVMLAWSFVPEQYKRAIGLDQPSALWNVHSAMYEGDFQDALSRLRDIQQDPSTSADEKALAALYTLGVEYRVSGDPSAIITDIQNLKRGITDTAVSDPVRVRLLNALAAQHSAAGQNTAVLDEIFSGQPFDSYLVEGDAARSNRNLLQWSYGLAPTSYAAISLARWHSELTIRDGTTWTMPDASAQHAIRLLTQADRLTRREMKLDEHHIYSDDYFWYRYWRAVVIGRLAGKVGAPYADAYAGEYDEFIAFALAHPAVLAKEILPYTRFHYAVQLASDGKDAEAAQQLDLLAADMRALPFPDANSFVLALRTAYQNDPTGRAWTQTTAFARLSPAFESMVEDVIGAAIE